MKRIVAPSFISLTRPLSEVLGQVAAAGVRLIELHGDAPDKHIDLTDDAAVAAAATVAADVGLRIHSVHSPFSSPSEEAWDLSQPDPEKRRRAVENHSKVIRSAGKLGAAHVVIHAGVRGRGGGRVADCRESLRKLSLVAREAGVKIAVENLAPGYLVGSVEDMVGMLDGLDPRTVGFCLDTGHATLGSDSPCDYIRALSDRVLAVHWHCNDGTEDTHAFPSNGGPECREFLTALAEIGYDLPITVEAVPPDGVPLADAFNAARGAFAELG
jgi:sugar phosphate isomerase/epimerase